MIYYVDSNSNQNGNGTKESPFKTIQQAADIAVSGDEVIVAPGIYREYVNPTNFIQELHPNHTDYQLERSS